MTELLSLDAALRGKRNRRLDAVRTGWLRECLCDERGRIQPILANAMIALRSAPQLAEAFTFDEMLRAPVLEKELPSAPNAEPSAADHCRGRCATRT